MGELQHIFYAMRDILLRIVVLTPPLPGGGSQIDPPKQFFFIFLKKSPLQPIMKPICKFLLDLRDELQTLIIPPKIF